MRNWRMAAGALTIAGLAAQVAMADASDRKYAVRAGYSVAETSGAALADDGLGNAQIWEPEGDGGYEVSFEWYASDLVGLEVQFASFEFDLEVESVLGEAEAADFESQALNLLVNFHVVRTERIDFGVGVHLGRIAYDDMEFEPPITPVGGGTPVNMLSLEDDFAMGVQAAVDINIGSKWGAYVGLRYQETSATADSFITSEIGVPFTVPVDPLYLRVGAVFRFGSRK